MRRGKLALTLIICMIITLAPITGSETKAASYSYSAEKALSYAKDHWNDGKGMCAEFVSNCVRAGGLNIPVKKYAIDCFEAIEEATGLSRNTLTLDSKGNVTKAANEKKLAAGDVVLIHCATHKTSPHIMLCGGYINGYASYYAHSKPQNNRAFAIKPWIAYEHTTNCDIQGLAIHFGASGDSKTDSPPPATAPQISSINRNMTVNVGAGNTLRFCSTVSYDARIGAISNNTTVYVYGLTAQKYENRTWAKIRHNNQDGWVNAEWLKGVASTATSSSKTYTVTYNANGGSGAPSSQKKTENIDLKLSSSKPAKAGYTFNGWSTLANSTSISYVAGATYKNNADVTLYAIWKAEASATGTVTIQYDANGGSGAPSNSSVKKEKNGDIYFSLSATKPTRNSYTFLGWRLFNDSAYGIDNSGQSISFSTGNSTSNETLTYYAQWENVSDSKNDLDNIKISRIGGEYPPAPYFSYGGGEKIEYDNGFIFFGEITRVTYYDTSNKMVGYSEFTRAQGHFKFTRTDYWYENGKLSYYVVNDLDKNGDVITAIFYYPDGTPF